MPLTESGKRTLKSYQKQYGVRKGRNYFYASIEKKVPGSSKWHRKDKK